MKALSETFSVIRLRFSVHVYATSLPHFPLTVVPPLFPPNMPTVPGALGDIATESLYELRTFVDYIYSDGYHYRQGRASYLINDFLLRLRGMSERIVSCVGADEHFRGVYRYLAENPSGQCIDPIELRNFWEKYSLTSHRIVFDNACEALRLAQQNHQRASEAFRETILLFEGGICVPGEEGYENDRLALNESVRLVQECVVACDLAMQDCKSLPHRVRYTT